MVGSAKDPNNAQALDGVAPGKEPLQVRIPRDIKRQFKARAALMGMEPNELFVEIWNRYAASDELDA